MTLGSNTSAYEQEGNITEFNYIDELNNKTYLFSSLNKVFTSSISWLFLFRVLGILTVTGEVQPGCFTAILFGCKGVNWISNSGFGNRVLWLFSVDTSQESRTIDPSYNRIYKENKSYLQNMNF